MGYQEKNGVTTVFAKLTDLGKKYLLTDQSRFEITKFSPFDDEVDYTLWNVDHDNGNAYYGAAIEALPIQEPVTSAVFQAKYNLIKDFPREQLRMPTFTISPTSVNLQYIESTTGISVQINNVDEPKIRCLLVNATVADISAPGATMIDVNPLAYQNFIGQSGFAYAKAFEVATSATITVSAHRNDGPLSKQTKLIIIGTTTNARAEVDITVQKNTLVQT
tara:strand:+ start:373 stop:1032 length:660 start_codon:yes stop_codon:yes gene_type:complete